MAQDSDVKLGQLTRFIFTAPSCIRSFILILLLGLLIDGASAKAWLNFPFQSTVAFPCRRYSAITSSFPETFLFSGTIAFTIPALAALLLTKPIIDTDAARP